MNPHFQALHMPWSPLHDRSSSLASTAFLVVRHVTRASVVVGCELTKASMGGVSFKRKFLENYVNVVCQA